VGSNPTAGTDRHYWGRYQGHCRVLRAPPTHRVRHESWPVAVPTRLVFTVVTFASAVAWVGLAIALGSLLVAGLALLWSEQRARSAAASAAEAERVATELGAHELARRREAVLDAWCESLSWMGDMLPESALIIVHVSNQGDHDAHDVELWDVPGVYAGPVDTGRRIEVIPRQGSDTFRYVLTNVIGTTSFVLRWDDGRDVQQERRFDDVTIGRFDS